MFHSPVFSGRFFLVENHVPIIKEISQSRIGGAGRCALYGALLFFYLSPALLDVTLQIKFRLIYYHYL